MNNFIFTWYNDYKQKIKREKPLAASGVDHAISKLAMRWLQTRPGMSIQELIAHFKKEMELGRLKVDMLGPSKKHMIKPEPKKRTKPSHSQQSFTDFIKPDPWPDFSKPNK